MQAAIKDQDRGSRGMTDRERCQAITRAIRDADKAMRRQYPVLKHQDTIGLISFFATTGTVILSSLAYALGGIPAWMCIVVNGIALGILREVEHDLIHNLYYADRPEVQNLLMGALWPFLGNLPHPWYRRKMHLLHHKTSGTGEDFEERLIGNGMPWGPLKVLAMIEPGLASRFRRKEFAEIPFFDEREFFQALVPVTLFYLVAAYGWILGHGAQLAAHVAGTTLPATALGALGTLDFVAVIYVLPNFIRQMSVQILSSSMHYYGDVDNQLQETQVMDKWYFFPLQLFCFNFGSTHPIHHFMVAQPFYLRQMVADEAHAAFKKYGLRYNDLESNLRGNRYQAIPREA